MQLRKAVDNLYLYDPQFEPASQQHLAEVGGSSARQQIARWTDVVTAMSAHSVVKFLVFDTHGLPGQMCLADGARIEGLDFGLAPRDPAFLQKNARILFLGCNIGEGSSGDRFLDEVGKYLLRDRGGIVGATTVPNIVFQLGSFASESYMDFLTGGRLKVKRYDASGALIGSRTVDRYGRTR